MQGVERWIEAPDTGLARNMFEQTLLVKLFGLFERGQHLCQHMSGRCLRMRQIGNMSHNHCLHSARQEIGELLRRLFTAQQHQSANANMRERALGQAGQALKIARGDILHAAREAVTIAHRLRPQLLAQTTRIELRDLAPEIGFNAAKNVGMLDNLTQKDLEEPPSLATKPNDCRALALIERIDQRRNVWLALARLDPAIAQIEQRQRDVQWQARDRNACLLAFIAERSRKEG